MRRFAFVLGFALLSGTGSKAGTADSDEPGFLNLTGARVLASPGWPAALEGFLPPGRAVEPLVLPVVPEGPLLLLGLWDSDPAARTLGRELGLEAGQGPRGGYVVDVRLWQGHPLARIIGQDAAALVAARFELETFLPEAKAAAPRSLDMTKPDEQGGVRLRLGRREVRPRFRIRGLGGLEEQGSLLDAASANANRLWLPVGGPVTAGKPRSLAMLHEQGVNPVAWGYAGSSWAPAPDMQDRLLDWRLTKQMEAELARLARTPLALTEEVRPALEGLLAWQAQGVRHFALRLPAYIAPLRLHQRQIHAAMVRRAVQALRPGGLAELLVIPPAGSAPASWPDMSGIPEALLGWFGSSSHALTITRAEAARVACAARVPVVLIETWMARSLGLPSMPRGRDADLGDVLAGVVVLPGPAAVEALALAWDPGAPQAAALAALTELLGCCATEPTDAEAFLRSTATNLEQALTGRFADPPWLRTLPKILNAGAAVLPPAAQRVLARYVETAPTLDGRLAEAAWTQAPATQVGPVDVRALSDGRLLILGVRVPDSARATALTLRVDTGWGAERVTLDLDLTRPPTSLPAEPDSAQSQVGSAREIEVAFGHYTLGGDPHPGRVFRLGVEITTASGTQRLAPDGGPWNLDLGGAVIVMR